MNALGSTPTYYDFDMFEEMNVSTGGADVQTSTPGVQLNFILKSGSNNFHGTSRVFYENKNLQASNLPDDLKDTLGGVSGKGNRLDQYADYGGEVGGPNPQEQVVGMGLAGAHQCHDAHAPGHPRQDDADRRERQDQRAVLGEMARQLYLLQRQQTEGRARRRSVQSARDHLYPEWSIEALQR